LQDDGIADAVILQIRRSSAVNPVKAVCSELDRPWV
jgi:hypothetical protein